MATMSNSSETKPSSPTVEILKECKLEICRDKVTAKSEFNATCTDYWSVQEDLQYKICCLVKAQSTHTFYSNFKYCLGQKANKETELVNTKIGDLVAKEAELQSCFKDLMKMIKETKDNMSKVEEVACRIQNCKEEDERCNPDLVEKLINGIPNLFTGKGDEPSIMDVCVTAIKDSNQKIKDAFNAGVDISGILTFSDIDSLESIGQSLASLLGDLKKDCDENIAYSSGMIDSSNQELLDVINNVSEAEFEKCTINSKVQAQSAVYDFLCDPVCDKDPSRIQEICQKFIEDLPPGGGEEECEETGEVPPKKTDPEDAKNWDM